MKVWNSRVTTNKIVFTGIWAVCINLLVECLSRRGLIKGVVHMVTAPYIFVLNTLIIALTLSVAWLFHRRRFVFGFISFLWILAGIVDFILLFFRKTPFTANDFMLINDAIKIVHSYINLLGIILMIAGFVAAVVGIFYYWKKSTASPEKINYVKTAGSIGILWCVLYGVLWIGFKTRMLEPHFGNITTAFQDYGFAYCFTNSIFDNGIDEPEDYAEENFQDIHEVVTEPQTVSEEVSEEVIYPNIIFLQLESFMNPQLVKDAVYSENPVPNFIRLYEKYPSGYLYVPSFGAGTANTEFEVITGMNLDDFGTGEYPYKTVLKNQACETICYNLKAEGYTSHGLHNNDGSFYNRYHVFSNLGFNTFTSIEYMDECKTNPTGWAKDEELTKYITKILDSTEKQDFIYAISVQGHGDYPKSEEELEEFTKDNPMKYDIKVENFLNEEEWTGFEYYLDQIKEMDDFLGELILELSRRKERTILVFYGDHLPGFSFSNENLESEDIYKSQYVIWSNYDYGFEDCDLEAFQLSSYVLEHLGIETGVINRYHQKYKDSEQYLEKLTMLEYDVLYGDKKVYDYQEVYTPVRLQMGIREIKINKAYNYNERICVEGMNFNKYSFVVINGKEYETECINPHTLVVENVRLEDGDEITVVQHGEDGLVLSTTSEFTYHPE